MTTLNDPIQTVPPSSEGIELPPLREPGSPDTPPSYVSSSGVTVMTAEELADARSSVAPTAPGFNRFGNRVSHMTGRFVLAANYEGYRIYKFQSADRPVEFPMTDDGWTRAWTAFRTMESQAA